MTAATSYKPPQRVIPCRVLTRAGWITASFHAPEKNAFADFLARSGEFLRVTQVTMQGNPKVIPFMALQREAMLLVVPPPEETNLKWRPETEPVESHAVACIIDVGIVEGTVETLKGVRVSDHFAKGGGFVILKDAALALGSNPGQPVRTPSALLNAQSVIAVSDAVE